MPRSALPLLFLLTVLASTVPMVAVERAGYDPARDPAADLEAAIKTATDSGRRILLEVGGEWCMWCHIFEKFIHGNHEVATALEKNFVVVKVNFSEENPNETFLGQYPQVAGYPHLFVLEHDGTFLHSQDTAELEAGRGYDRGKVLSFLKQWTLAAD